ncbi:MAG: hypothetical protein ACFFDT_00890 [Candidatus Hodarchaeota archaeon]
MRFRRTKRSSIVIIGLIILSGFIAPKPVDAATRTKTIKITYQSVYFLGFLIGRRTYWLEVTLWVTNPGTIQGEIYDGRLRLYTTYWGSYPTLKYMHVNYYSDTDDGGWYMYWPELYDSGQLDIYSGGPEEDTDWYDENLDGQKGMELDYGWIWFSNYPPPTPSIIDLGNGEIFYNVVDDYWS